jgi:hypothetical protein
MSWTHLADTTPTAKKSYRCYLCGREIAKGEKHIHRTGIYDKTVFRFRMHTLCGANTTDWNASDWEGFEEGQLHE